MSRHGHVIPNPNGLKARCGGPGICAACAREVHAVSNRFYDFIGPFVPDSRPLPLPAGSRVAAAYEDARSLAHCILGAGDHALAESPR